MDAIAKPVILKFVGDTTGLSRAFGKVRGEAGALEATVGRGGGRIASAFAVMARGAAMAGAAAGAAVGAAAGFGLKTAAATETAAIGFETLLGSAQKAGAFMADLEKFAAKTPFELPGLRDAASRFLAVGLEANRVIPIMTVLGDATASVGTGSEGIKRATTALTQMQQKGKVTGEEMLQLVEAGIPAWDALAAKLGVDVPKAQEMVTKNQVKVNDLFVALETKAGPALQRVAGMMDKQSASLAGMWSTLKDTVSQGLGRAIQPVLPQVKELLGSLTTGFGEFAGNLSNTFGRVFVALTPAIGPVLQLVTSLIDAFLPVIEIFAKVGGEIAATLAPELAKLAPHIGKLVTALGEFLIALVPLLPLIVDLAIMILPVLPPFIELATVLANVLVPVITRLTPLLTPLLAGFLAFKAVGALTGILSGLGGAFGVITTAFKALTLAMAANPFVLIVAAVAAAAFLIISNWDAVKSALGAIWDWISNAASTIWNFIKDNIVTVIRVIAAIATGGMSEMVLFIIRNWDNLKNAAANVVNWIRDRWNDLMGFIGGIPGRIWNALGDLFGFLRDVVSRGVEGAKNVLGDLVGFVAGLPGRILGALGDLGSLLWDAGKNIIQGLIGGIKNMVGAAIDAVKGAIGDVIGGAKRLLGIGSPSRVFADIGRNVMLGMEQGINALAGRPAAALARATGGLAVNVPTIGGGAVGTYAAGGAPPPPIANGRPLAITVNAATNADPQEIADEVEWALRTAGV